MMRLFSLIVAILLLVVARVEAFSNIDTLPRKRGARALFASSSSQTASSSSSRLKRIASLTEWSKTVDVKLGGVDIDKSESGAGLGLMTTQPVPSNTVVVSVPTRVALSVESPGDGVDDPSAVRDLLANRKVFRESPWFAQFSVYLFSLDKMASTKQGVDMRPWLDSLPRAFDTPIHWTQEERQELQYKYMSDAVARQEVEWKQLYENLLAAGTPQLSKMSFELFVWGCEIARSRAFSGGYTGSAFNPLIYAFTLLLVTVYVGLNLGTLEQAANGAAVVLCASVLKDFVLPKLFKKRRYVICPVIDMANHKSIGTTGDVSFEFFGDAYSLASTSDVAKGCEMYISYGTRSNDQLLQYYGFVEKDNPRDVYVMPPLREWDIGALEAACGRQFAPGRLQKLERAGLLGSDGTNSSEEDSKDGGVANPTGGVVITRAGGIDPAVLQALRALVSSEEEWQGAGEAIGNFAVEYGPENERLALLAARTGIEKELETKPTTRKEDEALLSRAAKSMEREETLAIEFRIEKKKLLEETLEKLR